MESCIHVGNKIDKQYGESLKDIVKTIFEVGARTRMDQATIVKALELVRDVSEIKNISILNSSFQGDSVVNHDANVKSIEREEELHR